MLAIDDLKWHSNSRKMGRIIDEDGGYILFIIWRSMGDQWEMGMNNDYI